MVSYLAKNGDTATIRCIFGEQSRVNAALYGGDRMLLDNILNDVNSDDNIKHVYLTAGFYDNEDIVHDKIRYVATVENATKTKNDNDNEEEYKDNIDKPIEINSVNDDNDWKCPECSDGECLKDKQGNKYPCLSCLQIDIGQRLLEKFGKEFANSTNEINKTLNTNNTLIEGFFEYLKQCGKHKD